MVNDIKKAQYQIQSQLKELTKIDEQKDEFAAMVSHELKTPLVPIQLYTEMLLKGMLGSLDDKQIKALHSIHSNILSLSNLVDDVLDVTKLELGRLALHKKQVELKDLLDENIESLRIFANDKKVALELELKTSGKIFCDPVRINQVLSNLIKNSIDFVPKNLGLIKLTIEKNPKSFLFTVTDNGSGISEENHKHLFQKFYKIDTSVTRKHGGTGLGLTICNGIVSSHGGKIWLDKEYTKGASFKFTIPVAKS
jgi:signal transduction histidine kinase